MDAIIIVLLIVVLAELTYLLSRQPNKLTKQLTGRPIFVDTSVLIDGRIVAVATSGFIGDVLYIPRSVVGELQFLADNADHEKRARARHGLDVVRELQNLPQVEAKIFPDGSKAEEGVDERLLKLAKQHGGAVCTIDYNLNKVAQVEDITVLNVNELAQNLRMAYLPGEKILLELLQKGQDSHQAVGHLADGTMVVVEQASKYLGKKVEIEFIRSLQTAAGRMMFAKLVSAAPQVQAVSAPAAATQPKQSSQALKPLQRRLRRPERPQDKPEKQETEGRKPIARQEKTVRQQKPERREAERTPDAKPQSQSKERPARKKPNQQRRPRRSSDAESSLVNLANR